VAANWARRWRPDGRRAPAFGDGRRRASV